MSAHGFHVTHTYGLSEHHEARARRLEDHGRDRHAWQLRHEGLPRKPRSERGGVCRWLVSLWEILALNTPDGYVEIKDRSKDIIISGGENISSLEVERMLYQHPSVLEAAVVARPDEQWGESPCAFITLKRDAEGMDEKALLVDIATFCRSEMPAYWVPKSLVFGPLPKTATGKVQKNILREKAKQLGPVRKSRM
ncbi:hypothetical protein HPP92_002055 [Vanilla planifolia]|uniref:AMP-binding enzyme C-terminal domain-containing protein n=1 Tax=Vanilla planifolia TaxID=51239 RepID=A0A835VE52_VANPL|nr:hypothetical protein HPP92_002055 [Vanilla planifolia]